MIRIFAGELRGLFPRKVLNALFSLKVEFHPNALAFRVDEAEGMTREVIHVSVVLRCTPVAEKNRDLVERLRRKRPEIPHHSRRLKISLRIALLRVDEVAELQGIAYEEHRRVVTDEVPVPFFGVEFDCEPARIARGIG